MSIKNNRDYLYLIWKSEKVRKQLIVGVLSRNGRYEFKYHDDIQEPLAQGFKPLVEFPYLDKVYTSEILFPTFASRLPDKKRRDMPKILAKYGLQEFDQFELLRQSGAKLPIDNYEFIDPIFDENKPFRRQFYLAGVRHYLSCEGINCSKSINIDVGEKVYLKNEPQNSQDSQAVAVFNKDGILIGHIPRYYNKILFEILKKKERNISCSVKFVNKNKDCGACIKLDLKVE
jgi:HipA-like protein